MQHADAALACHGDGHAGLGHGIHRCGCQRHAQANVTGKLRAGIDLGGHDIGLGGQKKHVIEGQAAQGYLVRVISTSVNMVIAHRGISLNRFSGYLNCSACPANDTIQARG